MASPNSYARLEWILSSAKSGIKQKEGTSLHRCYNLLLSFHYYIRNKGESTYLCM